MNTTSVDAYLKDGCGRCDDYQTPACKVHRWTEILVALREMLQATELVEEMKWGSPCYTLGGKNVVMLASLKDHCALSFFKGAALSDEAGVLEAPGPNSRFARYLKLSSAEDFEARREAAAQLIAQAIEVERSGTQITPPQDADPIPDELAQRLELDTDLARAFEALTPGRRRSHIIHIAGAKTSETRVRRVERWRRQDPRRQGLQRAVITYSA